MGARKSSITAGFSTIRTSYRTTSETGGNGDSEREARRSDDTNARSVGLTEGAVGDYRAKDARFGELRWRHFDEIVGKDDETGVLALFPLAFRPFLELRVGGA